MLVPTGGLVMPLLHYNNPDNEPVSRQESTSFAPGINLILVMVVLSHNCACNRTIMNYFASTVT